MKVKVVNSNRILSIFAVLLLICGLLSICQAQDAPEVIQEEAAPKLDINDDGTINILDLVLVASSFGEHGENDADVNGDSVVNILDLVLVASAFGRSVADTVDDTLDSDPESPVEGPPNTDVVEKPEPLPVAQPEALVVGLVLPSSG